MPPTFPEEEFSNREHIMADTVHKTVMAEQAIRDVVETAQSTGVPAPVDDSATESTTATAVNGVLPNELGDGAEEASFDASSTSLAADNPNVSSNNPPSRWVSQSLMRMKAAANLGQDLDVKATIDGAPEAPLHSHTSPSGSIEPDDSIVPHQILDAGAGSDTDTSRAESLDQAKDGSKHVRSNSVKKPISFKSVSVTKNFLAKTTPSTPVPKVGEKASAVSSGTSTPQGAKPRLVAKSGSGLRDIPRVGGPGNGKGGPDPMQVWNRNRPVPPPPPKTLTDEELKQQYGIHMATRLQADEAGKDNKWADIDDDEDAWVPETVEWMDGTKSTITPAEEKPAPHDLQVQQKKETPAEPIKPGVAPLQRSSSIGLNKTILKPGAHLTAIQNKPSPSGAKGVSDKPTLVAKPPAPVPVKSPWAPLPPIEKVSPIAPPVQPPSTAKFGHRDPHGFDAMPPQPSPARELAADDFDRSWKESDRPTRELFNSQSGRYEPVTEQRRYSRNDQNFRQPAVLQRPPLPNQSGAPEPSAAFQTSRVSSNADGAPWGRRRTSSNVSGGSGSFGRRFSMSKPSDNLQTPAEGFPTQNMPSLSPTEAQHPTARPDFSQQRAPFAAAQRGPHWNQHASPISPNAHHVSPYEAVSSPVSATHQSPAAQPAAPAVPAQDAVAIQQQIMREKREAARQRKLDEERQEEAARKERIRLKMISLGLEPPPEKDDKPKDTPVTAPLEENTQANVSPPKPPVPTSSGEVAQYGLMKVHQPQPLRKSPGREDRQPVEPVKLGTSEPVTAAPLPGLQHTVPHPPQTRTPPEKVAPIPPTEPRAAAEDSKPSAHSVAENRQQAWRAAVAPQEAYPGWGNSSASSKGNVWGPPNRDRALGNGTFDSAYSGLPARQFGAQQNATVQQAGPGIIAPPSTSTRVSPSATGLAVQPPQPVEASKHVAQPHDAFSHQLPNSVTPQVNGVSSVSGPSPHLGRQSQMAPPRASTDNQGNKWGAAAWSTLPSTINEFERHAIQMHNEEAARAAAGGSKATFKERYKQTSVDQGERLMLGNVERRLLQPTTSSGAEEGAADAEHRQAPAEQVRHLDAPTQPARQVEPLPPMARTEPFSVGVHDERLQAAPFPGMFGHESQLASSGRDSRPFGGMGLLGNEAGSGHAPHLPSISHYTQPAYAARPSRFFPARSASPPPPETSEHPAYSGDVRHPHVNLPIPKAVVKLPPRAPSPKAVTMPTRTEALRPGSQPIVAQASWQERFNGLLREPKFVAPVTSPPRQHALTVNSSSKSALENSVPLSYAATVSLPARKSSALPTRLAAATPATTRPTTRSPFRIDGSSDVTSRVALEDDLPQEPEFGSLPTVRLPKVNYPARPYEQGQRPMWRQRLSFRPIDATTVPEFDWVDLGPSGRKERSTVISIRLPGMESIKTRTMPHSGPNSRNGSYRGKRNNGSRNPTKPFTKSGGSRRQSGAFQAPRQN